jgi:hypothetical protein
VQIHTVEAHEGPAKIKQAEPKEQLASVEDVVRSYFKDIPIMIEVARCESGFTHIDPSTGKVFRGYANPKDVGVMQINEDYHLPTAKKMGLEITNLKDNLAYARYLYEQNGIRPWNASRPCWQGDVIAMR